MLSGWWYTCPLLQVATAAALPVQRRLQLEPTDLGCDANAVTLNFGAKNEPLTYWPSGDCDCDPESPCRQDVSGTCNPTTWCDACCETGSCAPGVSCDGYEEGGGSDQESCCALGSTMCTRPEYFLADGGESCSTACAARGVSWAAHTCNLQAITAAAASMDNCKDVLGSLGMGFGRSGVYSDDDSGCTYHSAATNPSDRWAQVMHSGRDQGTTPAPTCNEVNGDSSRQRVCACTDPAEKSNECDVVVDNLGGLGPDFDRPPERRYRGVGNVNGASIDLVLRNTTAFHIPNWAAGNSRWSTVNPCLGKFGDIWVALGGSFTLSFSFEYTISGEPAELAEFYFSIFDIDQSRNPWKSWQRGGSERIEVSGFADYALSEPASQSRVDVVDGSQDACACVDPLPCAHDAIGNDQCLPTTWCAACCATGTCQAGVSCFGYVAGGATWQGTCCAHGSTHCGESGNGESNVGIFKSQNAKGVPNPSDPDELTRDQKKVSVTTKFESKSSFEVLFKVNNPWRWGADDIFVGGSGRHFLFAGKSDLVTKCPPYPPSPPPPPPPPSPSVPPPLVIAELLHPDAECGTQRENLGRRFSNPHECMAAALNTPGCGRAVMWSIEYNAYWGCRCCSEGGTTGGNSHRLWDVWGIHAPPPPPSPRRPPRTPPPSPPVPHPPGMGEPPTLPPQPPSPPSPSPPPPSPSPPPPPSTPPPWSAKCTELCRCEQWAPEPSPPPLPSTPPPPTTPPSTPPVAPPPYAPITVPSSGVQVLDGKTGQVLGCVTDDTTTTIEVERERMPAHPYNLVFNSDKLSFSQAESHCVGLGGHLATVSSKAMAEYIDSTFIRPSATECHPAWIGLHDRDTEGTFTWTGDDPPVTGTSGPFTNWWGEEPNNCALSRSCDVGAPEDGDEDCVSLAVDCIYAPHFPTNVGDAWTDSGCEPGHFEYYPRASVCQVPTTEHSFELEQCKQKCKEAGFCCNDPNVGSNQLLSCAQACMIRARGTDEEECEGSCHAQDLSRGCSREVNGHSYSMCQDCVDIDAAAPTCAHGVPERGGACQTGCKMQPWRHLETKTIAAQCCEGCHSWAFAAPANGDPTHLWHFEEIALAPFVPVDDPTVGVLPTGDVFFKQESNDFSVYSSWDGGTAFPVEITVPYAGTYEVALVDRRGADEFSTRDSSPCKSSRVTRRGATDSFLMCKSDPRLAPTFGQRSGRYSGPSSSWRNEHCTTYHCCGRSFPFDFVQGVNTLWLTAREICSLASHVTVTRRGHLSIRGLLPQMVSASVTVYEVAPQLTGCDYTAYHKLARSDPDFGGGGSASVWVYLNEHEGDNTKCNSWGDDCCASNYWGEAQTCADGYVAVKVDDSVYDDWEHCPSYGRYTCMPGDSSRCSSTDGNGGTDCCASMYWDEPQTCADDYTVVETNDFCWYTCVPPVRAPDPGTKITLKAMPGVEWFVKNAPASHLFQVHTVDNSLPCLSRADRCDVPHAGTWTCPGTKAELQTYGTLAAFVGDELRGMSDVPTVATMGPLETQGTALYKFEVWANPVTETVEFKFCDAHGRKIELEGRGMEGETHHMGFPPADALECNSTVDCPTSGACTSHPVCLSHENLNGTRYCVEQVAHGELG